MVGPELILARIYQKIGYPDDGSCSYFKALVLSMLAYPGSKLKTVEYFQKDLGLRVSVYTIYRFLDELSSTLKTQIEEMTFAHTGGIGVVFYDLTSLYFKASEPDEFRISGFSKDRKHQHPQILIGLLVSTQGYPIGYQLFEGNTSEVKNIMPVLQSYKNRFGLEKPVVVADAALLSQHNIDALRAGPALGWVERLSEQYNMEQRPNHNQLSSFVANRESLPDLKDRSADKAFLSPSQTQV